MVEPHSSIIAGLSAVLGSFITGFGFIFKAGQSYAKLMSEMGALKELVETRMDNQDQRMRDMKESITRAHTRIDSLK